MAIILIGRFPGPRLGNTADISGFGLVGRAYKYVGCGWCGRLWAYTCPGGKCFFVSDRIFVRIPGINQEGPS